MSQITQELFSLNTLTMDELRLKWHELFNSNPPSFRRNFLIKELAYKIQILKGCSNISNEEVKVANKVAKSRLNTIQKEQSRQAVIIPPPGSVITKLYKDKEYKVKVIDSNRFECNGMIFRSLSALATHIAGTRWNGYTFFQLKRKTTN
jgi:hypothetical protein